MPFLTCGCRVSDRKGEQPTLQPSARSLRFVLLCTAPLCQATDNTQPELQDRGGGRDDGRERQKDEELHARTNCQLSVSLSPRLQRTPFLPHSSATEHQRKVKISTCSLFPSLSFDPVFVRLFSPSLPLLFLQLFFSFLFFKNFPGEVKWSGLLTQGDPD